MAVTRPSEQTDRSAIYVPNIAEMYAYRRRSYVSVLNKYCHKIIAVSQRTESLAKGFNILGSKLSVMYIGTKQAGNNRLQKRIPQKGSAITFLYMGLMRKDKGFYFLLDVLESLPSSCTSKMRLVIAAPITDNHALQRLEKVASKYSEIVFYDGYSHSDFPEIFKGVNVGVVPVLWEDNLPQVAIEMVTHGIPIITSDAGGASELLTCKKFVFKAGSKAHIEKIIKGIVEQPSKLKSYWIETLKLRTMSMHVSELFELYGTEMSNFASDMHFETLNFTR